ncbi:Uncharacterized protein SCF082_LOCUS44157 [Durusdinium trenchii]|uniref:Uncharacterized protein n=1 Tax=Durusdinium trenchii TaxID=1381693 RepID=A0ABP0R442_9DINO
MASAREDSRQDSMQENAVTAQTVLLQAQKAKELVAKLEQSREGVLRREERGLQTVPRPLGQRAARDDGTFRVQRELLLSQLRSDSEDSEGFTVESSEESDRSLDRRIHEEVIDELCWASPDLELKARFEEGCSLQEARAFCRMCLCHADRLQQAHARRRGEEPPEVQSPSVLVRQIASHREARGFALLCLQAIEDYESLGDGVGETEPS